ncbi:MAG: cytosine permease [Nitrososphaerota archaeon]
MLAVAGAVGTTYGVPNMVSLRPVRGLRGSYVPTALNIVQLVCWTGFEVMITAQAASVLTGWLFGTEFFINGRANPPSVEEFYSRSGFRAGSFIVWVSGIAVYVALVQLAPNIGASIPSFAVSKELLSPIVLRLSPTLLYSGTINNVTVYLQNTGTTTIKAITVETPQTTSQATWIQDSPLTLESLGPGEEHEFKTRLYITQGAPSSLPLTLRVTYFMQDNVPKQEERQIGVIVKGLVKFEVVDYSVLPERPSPGQVFSITAVVVNVGTSTAMSVSIRPGEVQGFRPFGQTRTFLGDVAVNTPSSVTISMTVLNTTRPGPSQIPLVITYRNQLGESFTESLTIPVVVGQPAQGGFRGGAVQTTAAQQPALLQTSVWTGLMVAGALAAGLVVGLLVGRRKR